jgi:surface protein
MKKMWRRTLTGLLAMSIVIGAAPADIGGLGLLGGTAMTANADVIVLEDEPGTIIITSEREKWTLNNWRIDASDVKDYSSKESVKKVIFTDKNGGLFNHGAQFEGDYSNLFSGYTNLEEVDFTGTSVEKNSNFSGMFKDCTKLKTVKNFTQPNGYTINMSQMFSGCTSLTTIENFHTSTVTNMSAMFKNCTGITSLSFDNYFNTANVTDMSEMFAGCSDLTSLDLSNFNTAKVENMNYMFGVGSGNLSTVNGNATLSNNAKGCESLSFLDLSSFDVKKVTSMEGMFSGCKNLQAVCVDATNWSHSCQSNYTFFSCFKLRGKLGKRYTGSGREIYADFAHIDTENSRGLLSTIDDYKLKSDPNGTLSEGETDYYKGYSNFNETGEDYLYDANTWFYQLTDVPAVAPTVNSAGNIAYSKATINDTEENYTFNVDKNVYTAVDNVTIPQIEVEAIAEVPATYGKNGTQAYYQDADGNKYILDNGQYVATTDEALVIPMTGTFTPVAATEASWTTPGNIACYQGGDGNYYKLNEDGSYTQLTDAERVIPAILGTHYPATPADYEHTGNTEYYVGTDGKYYAPDGNGGYAAITENSWVTPKLEMYMQASPNSSTSAVDVNIYAAIPDGAKPQDYTISFGDVSMTADNCEKVEKTVNGTTREYYLIKVAAPAKNMKDMYTYSIKHGDVVDKSGEASIRGYADTVIAGATYSDAIKKSCRAMLAYGAAAQNYKGYKTNDLAVDNNLSGTDGLDYSGINLPTSFSFDRTALNTKLTGASAPVTYYGMGLDMDADTHINFAFKVNEGLTQDAAIEYVNENIKINDKPVEAVANGTKFVVIKSEGIMISDLLKDLSLSFGGTDYTVNVKQYMTSVYNRDDSQDSINLKNVCKALLNYYNCVTGATQNVY